MPTRAQEFLKTVAADVTLRQTLDNATTPEARRQIIDAAGFADVSKEDITAALKQQAEAAGSLSDSELEAVAGGDDTIEYVAVSLSVRAVTAVTVDIVSDIVVGAAFAL